MKKPNVARMVSVASLVFASSISLASDVIVSADFNIGQGIYFPTSESCHIITPNHVMGSASSANIMLPTREYFKAQPKHTFEVDIAVLDSDIPPEKCRDNGLLHVSELEKLLGVYQEGVLKTRLADGSVLQTQVAIDNVGEEAFLSIKPKRSEDVLKQGYSGSVLYIAEQAAGMLLEVDDQGGIVYRSDALLDKLDSFFSPDSASSETTESAHTQSSDQQTTSTTNSHFKERLATNQVKGFPIAMQANSPVEFILTGVPSNELKYQVAILDKRENVFYQDEFWSTRNYKFAFTPQESEQLTVRFKGVRGFGEIDIQLKDYAFDAELRGQGNVLDIPGKLESKIARSATAEYVLNAEKNSPVLFKLNKRDKEFKYAVRILNDANKSLWYDEFWSTREYSFAFTPPESQQLTVRVTGEQGYGSLLFDIEQWTTNSELTGARNVAQAGDVIESKLANDAVAEYRMMMTQNAPIDFKFDSVGREMKYLVQVIDETGKVRLSESYWSTRENRFVFTPLSSDVHTIRITGQSGHGEFRLKLFDYD